MNFKLTIQLLAVIVIFNFLACKKTPIVEDKTKTEGIDQDYSLKVNNIILSFQNKLKSAQSYLNKSETDLISIDSSSVILEINLNYLYADLDTSYSNYENDTFITFVPIFNENSLFYSDLLISYGIISDSINNKLMNIVELQKDVYTISVQRFLDSNIPSGFIGIKTSLIVGKGAARNNIFQFGPNQSDVRYGFGEEQKANDLYIYGGVCNSNSGGGFAESGSMLLTYYANINLSLQQSFLPTPGYKLSYISLPNGQGNVQLSPLFFYNVDNPFYNNSNAALPRTISNTTYPTEIYSHIGFWEEQQISGTFGSRIKGPCLNRAMLNYYLNKMPILAQRTKNQSQYTFLSGSYPVQFLVTTSEHIRSGQNCAIWPNSNLPPSNLSISTGYCPDGEHLLNIIYKKAVIIYDPQNGN